MLRFDANLFRLAFTCSSNEETRYYLKGVFVEPHAQGGVTLTATDGHRLICIRDESGFADESAIIKLGDALKLCKPKTGRKRVVKIQTGENEATLFEEWNGASENLKVGIAVDVRIDGTFPNYRSVIPQSFSAKGDAPSFQGKYLASFGDLACELAAHQGFKPSRANYNNHREDTIRIISNDESSPALILFPAVDIAFGILMPCRVTNTPLDVPSWFRPQAQYLQAAE